MHLDSGFQRTLDYIRGIAESERHKGLLFERLMQTFFEKDPLYRDRFSSVSLWANWAGVRPGFERTDTGIDMVADERNGGYCAIQCKCYAPGTRIQKRHLDSFISASARDPFTARILVDTGDEWGRTAARTIKVVKPACRVLRFADLAGWTFDWPDLAREEPEALRYRPKIFTLRPHQRKAVNEVRTGLAVHDRGKLVMACGTGKTFTALRIAEAVAGKGRRVLYLVPSISLFAQTMREWATQKAVPHRYVGICSDTRAGRTDEDATMLELEIPVTTDPERIAAALGHGASGEMTVVFSTYQSLDIVARAQDGGAPPFDLVLCDEAHRTTGVDRPSDKTSPFVLVHDAERIRAAKRLYMTATPRIYTEGAKSRAARHDAEVFSMDDESTYGPELHCLPFSRAVDQNLLSDYKVVILALSEQHYAGILEADAAAPGVSEINITDTAKIVGCWRALQRRRGGRGSDGSINGEANRPLTRAIAFTNTIRDSQRLEAHWDRIVGQAIEQMPECERTGALRCEIRHVDGKHHALERKARIDWLKGESPGVCRVLTNARCLSEGIDVPALDAVFFMAPRKSQIEIVQAVGRTMRKAKGKRFGYIVLPVAIPPGMSAEKALNDNKRFGAVWGVLRALRSHDDRFDAEINQIDLNENPTDRIIVDSDSDGGQIELGFPPLHLPPGAIYAKIVDRCGDRKYWQTWAKDIADIFARLVERLNGLLADPANEALVEWFDGFHDELRASINESVTRESATDMVAQHILTRPVFDALFENYDFAGGNPIARALDELRGDFGDFGLENEIRDMERFYESVRRRARGLDNSEARQKVLKELYDNFFRTAVKKEADRLGIVFTPTEVVDFILSSADHVLREEFGCGLTDRGVNVLDPFTGTGLFLARLVQLPLIRDADLPRKYREELHANEIVLLAYYIAAVNIEEAYRGRRNEGAEHEPFGGIVLTDTFNLNTPRDRSPKLFLPDNSERVERQERLEIEVIVGNPPWSAGQRSSADDNPNVDYPNLKKRVAATYAARSTATLKNSLYDTYKMAIRWASDRIGEQGVIALVTNGSWIDGNVDSGVRACLAEEFTSIHVVNLRGNARTSGEPRRKERDNVFGQGSRAPVAITILVRNHKAARDGCRILYRDIGDYLTRKDKVRKLRDWGSVGGIDDWREITPDRHHDWIGQRDEAFQKLYPMGTKAAKAGQADNAVFKLFSNGYKTSRDAYIYNFSREACAENARAVVEDYMGAMQAREANPEYTVEEAARMHSSHVRWDRELKNNLKRRKATDYSASNISRTQYRPFVKQFCYLDYLLVNNKYQQDKIFPLTTQQGTYIPDRPPPRNRAICVPGVGATKPFSVLVADRMPDLGFLECCQCFPRWVYPLPPGVLDNAELFSAGLERVDNISDTALRAFREAALDPAITKDDIFDYVYGVLHAPDYRERFANDLAKGLPRVPPPTPGTWRSFADAGNALGALHLCYETCARWPLRVVAASDGIDLTTQHFRLGTRKMRYADKKDRRTLIINEHARLTGIPPETHQYVVNGRTPLEWFIDRYHVKTDRRSGIVNDANNWFPPPPRSRYRHRAHRPCERGNGEDRRRVADRVGIESASRANPEQLRSGTRCSGTGSPRWISSARLTHGRRRSRAGGKN